MNKIIVNTTIIALFLLAFLLIYLAFSGTIPDAPVLNEPETTARSEELYGNCRDAAGHIYPTVRIGDQVWMAENLRITQAECDSALQMRFTNGIERGPVVEFYDYEARYAYYNNDRDSDLGVVYSYRSISRCNICPEGFRIPTKADWETLIEQLGGNVAAGKKLLPGGSTGFNARMGGRIDAYGSVLKDEYGFWWSTGQQENLRAPFVYIFEVSKNGVVKLKGHDMRVGNYVRCIRK